MGWLRILLILRLSQPSLAGVGAGAELGKNYPLPSSLIPAQSKVVVVQVQVQDTTSDQDEGEQKKTIHHCWAVTRQINLKSITLKDDTFYKLTLREAIKNNTCLNSDKIN